MKTALKRTLSLLLSIAMTLSLFAVSASAETGHTGSSAESAQINPIYADTVSEEDLVHCDAEVCYAALPEFDSIEAVGEYIRTVMKSRTEDVTFLYDTDTYLDNDTLTAFIYDVMVAAGTHTGTPDEGDYLRWQYAGTYSEADFVYVEETDSWQWTVYLTITYYTDAEQEAEVTLAVEDLLDELNVWNACSYTKAETVFTWMTENIVFDYETVDDESYYLKYTAYAALINRCCVCQGYANLFYRLMLELGVDCRLILGIGNGGSHSWDIVEIDGKYYNIDATWDSENYVSGVDREYFLKCDDNFYDHARDSEYEEESFRVAYPMGTTDCPLHYMDIPVAENTVEATCTHAGSEDQVYYCTDCGKELNRITTVIPALPHTYNEGLILRESEIVGTAIDWICDVCGTILKEDTVGQLIDVSPRKWYAPIVEQAYLDGIMSGTSENTFEPTGSTSRAMFVQILYAIADKPSVDGLENPFTDVPENAWYRNAVVWAAANNVTSGTGDGCFSPNDPVTREQIALLLYAYCGRPETVGELAAFADTETVHSWAADGIRWAVENGIMSGSKDGDELNLRPLDSASRAEAATMMLALKNKLEDGSIVLPAPEADENTDFPEESDPPEEIEFPEESDPPEEIEFPEESDPPEEIEFPEEPDLTEEAA